MLCFARKSVRHTWSKPIHSGPDELVRKLIRANQTILLGGFGLCGIPELMIKAISATQPTVNNLTLVSNDTGYEIQLSIVIAPMTMALECSLRRDVCGG